MLLPAAGSIRRQEFVEKLRRVMGQGSARGGAREAVERKDRGVLRVARGEAENAERHEREPKTLRRTEWKHLMKRLSRTLAEYIDEKKINEFAPSPLVDMADESASPDKSLQ